MKLKYTEPHDYDHRNDLGIGRTGNGSHGETHALLPFRTGSPELMQRS
jgi:hypothetical protein